MHHFATGLPKGLTRTNFSGCVSLELEADPALQYVAEYRSRVTMWLRSGIGGWNLDELCHRVCTLRD